ncbi:helix-turn-helix transcriptional regulator [Haloarcula amylovorans]|uniref:helix-turn-helix transcriptional regulator n=1 Tax=Haloarcula amylovorans TaxID=2562280 RepID=UPI001075F3BC|nr:helix-turn-helix transcriptional regulator [Halomicroarcula amylolytica]
MHDLTGFQRDILYVIAKLNKPHGLEIKDELQEHYDQNIRHGRLYPNLDTLVEARLIEKGKKDDRSNEYKLRNRGKRELKSRLKWELSCLPEDLVAELDDIAIKQTAE